MYRGHWLGPKTITKTKICSKVWSEKMTIFLSDSILTNCIIIYINNLQDLFEFFAFRGQWLGPVHFQTDSGPYGSLLLTKKTACIYHKIILQCLLSNDASIYFFRIGLCLYYNKTSGIFFLTWIQYLCTQIGKKHVSNSSLLLHSIVVGYFLVVM